MPESDDIKVEHEWKRPDLLALKNEDPDYHYRWCKTTDENMNYKMHAYGYRIADDAQMRDSYCNELGAKDSGETARQVGDLILMKCPRQLYEARRKAHDKMTENQPPPRERFKEDARRFSKLSGYPISVTDNSEFNSTNKKYYI